MENSTSGQAATVWGDKAIIDELEKLLGWRPSKNWFRKWSDARHPNRLPVKRLQGSNRRCADLIDLQKWKEKNIK